MCAFLGFLKRNDPFRQRPDHLKVMVGLGNPGRVYSKTRHNAGWMALDRVAESCDVGREEDVCQGILAPCGDIWLFKPLTYMNLSGPPVAELCRRAGVDVKDVLVLVDDLNLPLGSVRLRPGGSSGGHRGLESLVNALRTEEFPRLRMGVGPHSSGEDTREFVLSPFARNELDTVQQMIDSAAQAALCWARDGMEAAMNRFNRKIEA